MNVTTGTQIYEYSLEIFANGKVEKKKEEHEIIAVREHEKKGQVLALTDRWQGIEVIQTNKDKDKLNTSLNDASVWENKWRSKSLTDSIRGIVYTTQNDDKKVYDKLKKEISKFVSKEYGKYSSYKMVLDDIDI